MKEAAEERLAELVRQAQQAGTLAQLEETFARLAAESRGASSSAAPPGAESAQATAGQDEVFPGRFGMLGASPAMVRLFDLIERVAGSDVSVLVVGETGTGKELVARALHEHGTRAAGPFLAENCAAVPAELLESELFGHEKGSFTGAHAKRVGHFLAADGGTLFLDEIGDMPLAMQAKLLRVLEEREVRPVGSNKTVPVDVRLVAATHRDLHQRCSTGEFREDLLYRLQVVTLELPPLRERKGDVRLLARHFLSVAEGQMGRAASLDGTALAWLEEQPWPGNVRQLENAIQRAVAISAGQITIADLAEA